MRRPRPDEGDRYLKWLGSREGVRHRERERLKLARLRLNDPASFVAAQRRARDLFWGALITGRIQHRSRIHARRDGLVPVELWRAMVHVPRCDAILTAASSTRLWRLDPDGLTLGGERNWPAHVQWGADRLVGCARDLRGGRLVSAIVVTRSQLERWTLNVAHHHKIEPSTDEGTADFISRAWRSAYRGFPLDMGAAWSELSEWLHGRGGMVEASRWPAMSGDLARRSVDLPAATVTAHRCVAQIADATFRQVRGAVAVIAEQQGRPEWAALMREREFEIVHSQGYPMLEDAVLRPIDHMTSYSDAADEALRIARGYRLAIDQLAKRGQVARAADHVAGAMIERHARNLERFRWAWATEEAKLGSDFHPDHLSSKLHRFNAYAETAEVVSLWADTPEEQVSLRIAGAAQRSAFRFWLEDSDASLACMRVVLEHTCIARTWRRKPTRARRLQEAGGSVPSRWIEAAGWRRAAVLGRALGEFSHVSLRARWKGARRLLREIQPAEEIREMQTARAHALMGTSYLLASELAHRLGEVDADLEESFREQVTMLDADAHTAVVNELLERSFSQRSFDFGPADLTAT